MRNKNHNKRINHHNGLKIAIMLLGVMSARVTHGAMLEDSKQDTASSPAGGPKAAVSPLTFYPDVRGVAGGTRPQTARGRTWGGELRAPERKQKRSSSLGCAQASSSRESYCLALELDKRDVENGGAAPRSRSPEGSRSEGGSGDLSASPTPRSLSSVGSQARPERRPVFGVPLPLEWRQEVTTVVGPEGEGGGSAADAVASPTLRSRSPVRPGSQDSNGSRGSTSRSRSPVRPGSGGAAGSSHNPNGSRGSTPRSPSPVRPGSGRVPDELGAPDATTAEVGEVGAPVPAVPAAVAPASSTPTSPRSEGSGSGGGVPGGDGAEDAVPAEVGGDGEGDSAAAPAAAEVDAVPEAEGDAPARDTPAPSDDTSAPVVDRAAQRRARLEELKRKRDECNRQTLQVVTGEDAGPGALSTADLLTKIQRKHEETLEALNSCETVKNEPIYEQMIFALIDGSELSKIKDAWSMHCTTLNLTERLNLTEDIEAFLRDKAKTIDDFITKVEVPSYFDRNLEIMLNEKTLAEAESKKFKVDIQLLEQTKSKISEGCNSIIEALRAYISFNDRLIEAVQNLDRLQEEQEGNIKTQKKLNQMLRDRNTVGNGMPSVDNDTILALNNAKSDSVKGLVNAKTSEVLTDQVSRVPKLFNTCNTAELEVLLEALINRMNDVDKDIERVSDSLLTDPIGEDIIALFQKWIGGIEELLIIQIQDLDQRVNKFKEVEPQDVALSS